MSKLQVPDPARIALLDKEERDFMITNGVIRKLMLQFKCATREELFARETTEIVPPMLFLSQCGENKLDEERFYELIPLQDAWLTSAYVTLRGLSLPEKNPTQPEQTPAQENN